MLQAERGSGWTYEVCNIVPRYGTRWFSHRFYVEIFVFVEDVSKVFTMVQG